ncbi:crotonobetaine/carnitine-CoA ligase [Amycolatopsis tolypomycina]|uniref:Crotonobetaine/carnitine-CoA ligase n=1 Tax=Amycolatopsis tolypomycina TaxID=208445 RepID=A0A1H4ZC88_9PSEU|nr:class I adenylate-forming enzyme family protein [Amycolatopsis tolypomycina]SED27000.1 crotonobetaine/carnitine-CoA ligase [Amycolatopsis tolypomycina]
MTHLRADLTPHQQSLLGKTMPDALDAAAAAWPDSAALHEIEGEQRSLTWSELRTAVTSVRSGLEATGLRPGDKVGVITRNQVEFPIAWLAIVEAGAAIVPLNPKYTYRELAFVLGDAGATWLIGTEDLIEQHATDGRVGPVGLDRVVAIGASDRAGLSYEKLVASTPTPRRTAIDPLEVTNIQFTSGTTGLPKGCLLTHEYWMELGLYGVALEQEARRILADHPFYYMQNQAYFMLAVVRGAALYITPGLSRRKFMGWLHDYRIDFAWIDEDMLEFPEDPRDKSLALKQAPVAGLPVVAYAPIEERFGIKARECYASTEIGSGTAVPFDRDDLAGTGSMGFCYPNRETKVIDKDLGEVPAGTVGELCVRGTGMMLGYHNRPEANAELFLPGGWFRTGDLVVKDHDGQHYFRGRLRDMIRRSGENISAAEVELHLDGMPGVEAVAAVPVPDPDREEEVKVIVVPEAGVELTAEQVVAWARGGLAPFKVPRYVEFRAELPYTPSGKVHKAALKQEPHPLHEGVIDTRS